MTYNPERGDGTSESENNQPANGGEHPANGGKGASTKAALNGWSFLSLFIIAAAVVTVTIYVVRHYAAATDAGTILGIVIPVFATVSAAIFGVQVGYQTGTKMGEETGKTKGRHEAADLVDATLSEMADGEDLVRTIETRGFSPQGASYVVLGAESDERSVQIPYESLQQASDHRERLKGIARTLRAR